MLIASDSIPLLCLIAFEVLNYSLKSPYYLFHVFIFSFPPGQCNLCYSRNCVLFVTVPGPKCNGWHLVGTRYLLNDTSGTLAVGIQLGLQYIEELIVS